MRYALGLLLVLLVPAAAARAAEDDLAALLDGVKAIGVPGVPGTIRVFGKDAFPVVTATIGEQPGPVVAATRLGRGRVVMFAHNGYFGNLFTKAGTGRLLVNACRWASGRRKAMRIGVRGRDSLVPHLRKQGLDVTAITGTDWGRLEVDVLISPIADISEKEMRALRAWLRKGRGLLCGLPGWGWQQLNQGKDLATENMGNRLLAPAGLVWGGGTIQNPKDGLLKTAEPPHRLTHAAHALEALLEQSEGRGRLSKKDSALAVATVTRCIRDLPPDDKVFLPRVGKLLKHSDDPRFIPTHDQPLTDEAGLGKLLLTLQVQRDKTLPAEKIRAHPAAAVFPGSVPKSATRVRRVVKIDTGVPGWHSTGLYAPPGEFLSVTTQATDGDLSVRIGAHKDRLWHKAQWQRVPEITVTAPIESATTRVANAFGGLVYVVVPPRSQLGTVRIVIAGAVESPLFVLGKTSLEDWRSKIRNRKGPWAELATSKVIITVPSENVRALDDPEALMTWWDEVLDACADLATIPRERERPERYVADEQISAGYMHAGYPIMTHLDAAPRFVDLKKLSTQGDWGMFHEMGHNHQHKDWTFGGTIEVTCNLFSLYCMEVNCSKGKGHGAMSPENIAKNTALYRKGGSKFEMWKRKPFTALIMYHQMQQAFGWDAYKKVFAEYRQLAPHKRPKNDDQKRDQWLVRMSRTVGKNLGPVFESWGVPTSEKARKQVADLPAWMP